MINQCDRLECLKSDIMFTQIGERPANGFEK